MKITANDLYAHLFAQLERLGDEQITEEQLKLEIQRSKAIAAVSAQVIDLAREENRFLENVPEIRRQSGSRFFKPLASGT